MLTVFSRKLEFLGSPFPEREISKKRIFLLTFSFEEVHESRNQFVFLLVMTKAAITSKSPSVYPVFSVSCNLEKFTQLTNAYRAKTAISFFFSKVQCFERAELTEDHTILDRLLVTTSPFLPCQTTHRLSNKQTDRWPYRQES